MPRGAASPPTTSSPSSPKQRPPGSPARWGRSCAARASTPRTSPGADSATREPCLPSPVLGAESPSTPCTRRTRRCACALEKTEADLAKARLVIEVQGNVSALLGELLEPRGAKPEKSTE